MLGRYLKRMLKKRIRGFERGLAPLLSVGRTLKSLILPPTAKKADTEADTYSTHSAPTITNSWRRQQMKIDLLSHKEGFARGKEIGRGTKIEIFFFFILSGLEGPNPFHTVSLLCDSQRCVFLYLKISLSISLHLLSSSLLDLPLPLFPCLVLFNSWWFPFLHRAREQMAARN